MNTEPKKISDAALALFRSAVIGIIGKNKDHGWVQADSVAGIDSIVAEDATNAAAKGETLDKYSLSEDANAAVAMMVNPSACAQQLEKWGVINARTKRQSTKVNPFAAAMGT